MGRIVQDVPAKRNVAYGCVEASTSELRICEGLGSDGGFWVESLRYACGDWVQLYAGHGGILWGQANEGARPRAWFQDVPALVAQTLQRLPYFGGQCRVCVVGIDDRAVGCAVFILGE